MVRLSIIAAAILLCTSNTFAQSEKKQSVYSEIGVGFGKTLFFGDVKSVLKDGYGGAFDPGTATNLIMGFSFSPESWKGFGVGSKLNFAIGNSVKGDNNDAYVFNYYNFAITTKYFAISKKYNEGFYVNASAGLGQFTSERSNGTLYYKHLYGLGFSFLSGAGYSIPVGRQSLSFEVQYDYSTRDTGIDGKGESALKSGQFGANIIYSF